MMRFKNISWLAAGLVALAGFANAAAPAAGGDEAAIRAQTTSWVKAYNGGDAKAGNPAVAGQPDAQRHEANDVKQAYAKNNSTKTDGYYTRHRVEQTKPGVGFSRFSSRDIIRQLWAQRRKRCRAVKPSIRIP